MGILPRLRSHLLDTKGILIDGKKLDKNDLILILASCFLIENSKVFICIIIYCHSNNVFKYLNLIKDHDIITKSKEILPKLGNEFDLNKSMRRYFGELVSLLGLLIDKDDLNGEKTVKMERFLSTIPDSERLKPEYEFVTTQDRLGSCKFCMGIEFKKG